MLLQENACNDAEGGATTRSALAPVRRDHQAGFATRGNLAERMPAFCAAGRRRPDHEQETYSIAAKYLAEIKGFSPDALVLGCTHYPILRDVIQQTVGADVKLVDSGAATADEVARLLLDRGLSNSDAVIGNRTLCGDLDHFYVTDAAERFSRVAERFLGAKPSKLEAIEVYGRDG